MPTLPRHARLLLLVGGLFWAGAAAAQSPEVKGGPAAPPVALGKAAPAHADLMDINTATEDQLKTLPGIDAVYAGKIVAGRPYKNKTELLTRKILPRGTYAKIRYRIIARQS